VEFGVAVVAPVALMSAELVAVLLKEVLVLKVAAV